MEDCDIANYANDNTPYLSEKNVEEVLNGLENVSSNLFQWFTENQLKGHASKCHLLISSGENVHVNIGTSQIKSSDCERLLGTDIDCKLSFENHINQICSKARAKIKALARITPFLNKRKRKQLMNAFFKSQFSYCPSSFTGLLEIDNIQVLATELYKFVNGLSPTLVSDCFKLNNMTVYNTRNWSTFFSRPIRTVFHVTESLSHLGPKFWELVPSDMKNLSTITAFKKSIKQWKPHDCPCRLCRTYIYRVGFV